MYALKRFKSLNGQTVPSQPIHMDCPYTSEILRYSHQYMRCQAFGRIHPPLDVCRESKAYSRAMKGLKIYHSVEPHSYRAIPVFHGLPYSARLMSCFCTPDLHSGIAPYYRIGDDLCDNTIRPDIVFRIC